MVTAGETMAKDEQTGGMQDVAKLLSSEVESMGYQYWGGEFSRHGKRLIVRVYIDSRAGDGGVTLDDCAKVSAHLSASLDLRDPIRGAYELEISSPGLERPLFNMAHYKQYIGCSARLRCYTPIDGRRRFVGKIVSVSDDGVEIEADDGTCYIDFSNINDAKLVYSAGVGKPHKRKRL